MAEQVKLNTEPAVLKEHDGDRHFPILIGISMKPFLAGVVALAICDSAFEAEIFRGGIQSISPGQWEAGKAIGMT